jgi:hypothetical protein
MPHTSDAADLKARLTRIKGLLDDLEKASSESDRQREIVNCLLRELEHRTADNAVYSAMLMTSEDASSETESSGRFRRA